MLQKQLFITGIHTDTGKTHLSAIFCLAFGYTYHKLIQAGMPTDSQIISSLCDEIKIIPPSLTLQTPASPHIGQKIENLTYNALRFTLPPNDKVLIELAGGLYTPIDESHTMLDFIHANPRPIVLVGRYYVGCINHLLLSLNALVDCDIRAVVMMEAQKDSKVLESIDNTALIDEFITSHTSVPLVRACFPTKDNIKSHALSLYKNLSPHIKELL